MDYYFGFYLRNLKKFSDDRLMNVLDILIPSLYLGFGILYSVLAEAEVMVQFSIIPMCIGVLLHIYRTIYACKNYSL